MAFSGYSKDSGADSTIRAGRDPVYPVSHRQETFDYITRAPIHKYKTSWPHRTAAGITGRKMEK